MKAIQRRELAGKIDSAQYKMNDHFFRKCKVSLGDVDAIIDQYNRNSGQITLSPKSEMGLVQPIFQQLHAHPRTFNFLYFPKGCMYADRRDGYVGVNVFGFLQALDGAEIVRLLSQAIPHLVRSVSVPIITEFTDFQVRTCIISDMLRSQKIFKNSSNRIIKIIPDYNCNRVLFDTLYPGFIICGSVAEALGYI